jgi:hypothetical protein
MHLSFIVAARHVIVTFGIDSRSLIAAAKRDSSKDGYSQLNHTKKSANPA